MSADARSIPLAYLLPAFFGERRGLVALMTSFFDESEAEGFLTVGGYLFRKSKVRPFEAKWKRMLKQFDVPYFRMSAVNVEQPPFDKLSKEECDQLARQAIALVTEFATYGYFGAIRTKDFDEVVGEKGFAYNPYTLCAHVCWMGMRYWAEVNDPKALISYFFEAGARHQSDAARVFDNLASDPGRAADFRYAGHGFLLKERSMPTQAADMLAWHANKQMRRVAQGHTTLRGDFSALVDGVTHGFWEATKPRLREMVDGINAHARSPAGNRMAGMALRDPKLGSLPLSVLRRMVEGSD